jgi:hypothetical protein
MDRLKNCVLVLVLLMGVSFVKSNLNLNFIVLLHDFQKHLFAFCAQRILHYCLNQKLTKSNVFH